jgi:hypothetical protein
VEEVRARQGLLFVFGEGVPRDPDAALFGQRLHHHREDRAGQLLAGLVAPGHHEGGHGHAVVLQDLLRERLVLAQHQRAVPAARVGDAAQLEHAGDVAFEIPGPVERLDEVPDEVGLDALDQVDDLARVLVDGAQVDLVAKRLQRGHDVPFGTPVRFFPHAPLVLLVGRGRVVDLEEHENAKALLVLPVLHGPVTR